MSDNVNAEIIAIGTEILLGEITDTNSVYIAQQLRDIGINLYYMTSVGDNEQRIAAAIQHAMSRADVIITCGGLGPTVDDMTRQAVADATRRKMEFHQQLYDQIAQRFAQFRAQMTENNRRQAFLPANAIPIENPVGTAPGFIVEHKGAAIISLPGVPREMKFLLAENVIPYLRQKYQLGIIKARTLKTAGIGESSLDDMLGDDLLQQANPSIGLAAHHGIIDIRLTAKAESEAEADAMLENLAQQVIARAGRFVFGEGDTRLEDVLALLLNRNRAKIGVIEAGLGGVVASTLRAAVNGDSIISIDQQYKHPNEIRAPGNAAISLRDLAANLAQELSARDDSQAGIVILSLPDVTENADIDYATTVAVSANGALKQRVYGFGARSEMARTWVSRWALAYVWQQLKEQFEHVD